MKIPASTTCADSGVSRRVRRTPAVLAGSGWADTASPFPWLVKAGKPVEALHLTDVVLAGDSANRAALSVRLEALTYLDDRTENYIESGFLEHAIKQAQDALGTQ